MFQVDDFAKEIKKFYSSDITFEPAKEIQKVIDSFSGTMELVVKYITNGWFFAWVSHPHYYYTGPCGMMIRAGHSNFLYVKCRGGIDNEPVLLFFDRCDEQTLYHNLVKVEKLKAFL